MMGDTVTLEHTGYRVHGIAFVTFWGGADATIQMKSFEVKSLNETEIAAGLNDGGFGVQSINGATCFIEKVYGGSYTVDLGRMDFEGDRCVYTDIEEAKSADLSRTLFSARWSWLDAVELMGELKDVFLALPKEQKKALMDKHERSISKGMEAGIMTDWTVVMEAAIECSGLLEDLEMLKEGGDVSDEEEMRMGASEQDED